MQEILILILFFLLIFNYTINRDFAFPPVIFHGIWFLVILIHYLTSVYQLLPIPKLSFLTVITIMTGHLFFTFGGLLVFRFVRISENQPNFRDIKLTVNKTIIDAVLGITLLLTPLFIWKAIHIGGSTKLIYFFINLRSEIVKSRGEVFGILKYSINFFIFNLLLSKLYHELSGKRIASFMRLALATLLMIIYSIFSTGRTFLLFAICLLVSATVMTNRITLKSIVKIGFFLALLFTIFSFIFMKGMSINWSMEKNLSVFGEVTLQYVLGGVVGFDTFVKSHAEITSGEFLFRFFKAILYKSGITANPPIDLVRPFIFKPIPTNVYSIFYTYVYDYGIIFSMIMLFIFGFLSNLSYIMLKSRKLIFIVIYGILLYCNLMSFFQEQMVTLASQWIQLIGLSFIVFQITFRNKQGRNN